MHRDREAGRTDHCHNLCAINKNLQINPTFNFTAKMTNKEKIFGYRITIARLQGSVESIITNLELPDPNVTSEIERLKAALKRSEESIKPLEKPNKITIFN